jgi:hypothetical protein
LLQRLFLPFFTQVNFSFPLDTVAPTRGQLEPGVGGLVAEAELAPTARESTMNTAMPRIFTSTQFFESQLDYDKRVVEGCLA